MEILRRVSTAFYQKMMIPREKGLSPSAFGVYPRPRELPSPVCCFRIMHIRTGAMWVAYGEMMWITSQISFWAAQAITGGWTPMSILLGFLTVIMQIILVVHLIKGIREFRLSLLIVYLCGIVIRIAIFLTSLFVIIFLIIFAREEPSIQPIIRFAYIKVLFLIVSTMIKMYAFVVIRRCHDYIERTKSFFRTPQEISCSHSLSFGKCEKEKDVHHGIFPSPSILDSPLISSSNQRKDPHPSQLNSLFIERLCPNDLPSPNPSLPHHTSRFHPEI